MLRTALIGLPSAGKTTLFQLMTAHLDLARGSHARLEAHVGVARVPDSRLDRLAALFPRKKRVPATVEFADLPGTGRTSTQSLLDVVPFRDADALVHVVRAFREPSIPHPSGAVRPEADARAMEDELILADLGVAERRLERLERDLKKTRSPELISEHDVLGRCKAALESGQPLRALELHPEDRKRLRGFQLLSAKPLLLVMNLDEADLALAADSTRAAQGLGLGEFLRHASTRAVAVCAKIELEISQLEPADAAAFLADLGLGEPGTGRVIRATYDLLGYITFLTVGENECRAWSVPRGTSAHVAAGEIHSDIARGFIRAEVVHLADLVARGSIAACREHGEVRLEGKDYVVQDGDVITFRFAT
jgi:GTP-binding protein YchF